MAISGIGSGDNPFKNFDKFGVNMLDGTGSTLDTNANGIEEKEKGDIGRVQKMGTESADSRNSSLNNLNPDAKIDKTYFTHEDNIQEIDPEDFQDDI